MDTFEDYYQRLGISSEATPEEIKAAFKKLALRYHPDVYKGDDAHERMRHLLQAYQTLNDPEARQRYDARYGYNGTARSSSSVSASSNHRDHSTTYTTYSHEQDQTRKRAQEVSARARRDRKRFYAFPDFFPGREVHINLIDVAYTLSTEEAQALKQYGLLRGHAPFTGLSGNNDYFCHRCHHHWPSSKSISKSIDDLPRYCPACEADDWSEYLLLRCLHCGAVFESEQIRYEVGSYNYGKNRRQSDNLCPPYELFPLCPYCGTARWSHAEDERVSELRLRHLQRSSRLRIVLITTIIFVVAIISAFALGLMH